jgi:acyl-CoA hydrolase
VVTGEVCGSPELYDLVKENEQVEFHPCSVTHDLIEIAKLPRFVSINSAVEVDLQGQVNGETIDGVQISGVGGSLDFVEAAAYSTGGMSIIALPSTTEDGKRSKIVRHLTADTPVTIPRFCADYVVTEYGAARLRGKTLRERHEALINLAHPDFRAALVQ